MVPGDTFFYVATLQAAYLGPMRRLSGFETRDGQGAGKQIDKVIVETTDLWAFGAHGAGLEVGLSA